MTTTAFINIWQKQAGAVAWDSESGLGAFEFDPGFLKNELELSPLMMPARAGAARIYSFPELRASATFKGLPGLLADVLPDKYGNALINNWLGRMGRPADSLNPVEMLCFIGKRGVGAMEFEPAIPKSAETASKIEISSLVEVAEGILSQRKDFNTRLSDHDEKALLDILKIGTSAGGARAKAVIAFNSKTREVRSGQAHAPAGFSQWILKFDGVTDKQFGASSGYGRVEMAYHHMAVDAAIEMTECRLLEEHGRAHFMTKRFDRGPDNEKYHVQSFCAMRHFDFNEISLYSYEQLFETMRMLALPYPQAEQLFRRMVFNVLSRNCDDHTKNFSFIMDSLGNWRLSPAYDLCHAYRPGSEWVSQHALSVNGKRNNIRTDDLLAVAKQMNIKKAASIVKQIFEITRKWRDYSDAVGVAPVMRDAIWAKLPG